MGLLTNVTTTEAMDTAMAEAMDSMSISPSKASFVRYCIAYTLEHEFDTTLLPDEVHPKRGRPFSPPDDELEEV